MPTNNNNNNIIGGGGSSSSSGGSGTTTNLLDNNNHRDITEDTYDVGIANGMRELKLRLESELEEHEKMWSPPDETTSSHN